MMRLVLVAAVIACVGGTTPALADGPTQPLTDARTFELRDLRLGDGEWVAISLHPSEVPIELTASRRDLEACPASFDGNTPEAGAGSSWPSFAGFPDCLPFDADGRVTLPSTVVDTFHLAFLVRAQRGTVVVDRLTVNYEPADGYFVLRTPAIAPARRGPLVAVTPGHRDTLGVDAGTSHDDLVDSPFTVSVRQHGSRVTKRPTEAAPTPHDLTQYGPITLDDPVVIRARNRGARAIPAFLWLDWE